MQRILRKKSIIKDKYINIFIELYRNKEENNLFHQRRIENKKSRSSTQNNIINNQYLNQRWPVQQQAQVFQPQEIYTHPNPKISWFSTDV